MTARTVSDLLLDRIAATPKREAFRHRHGSSWHSLTWSEVGERVRNIASGLRSLGLADEERCAILSSTRIEWILVDLGVLCAGGATTTIYPASTADECAYILGDSASSFVFAENDTQVAKLVAKRSELSGVRRVILLDGEGSEDGWIMTLADLEARGRDHDASHPGDFERIAKSIAPDALATLIYTSGTTGKPKGVELIHDCWVYEAEAIDKLGLLREDDVQFLWLPLAHSFGKVLEVAQLRIGFSTAVDGVIERLVENLGVVQPTFVAAVPRIFEKVHNKVVTGATEGGGVKARIFEWAMKVGRKCSKLEQQGKRPGGILALERAVAQTLVYSKLQARFGGKLRFFVSGSAPLARDLAEFFHGAGVLILEGYGLTESSAANFVNRPDRYKFGTVGPPLPGTEVKLAEDGEILISSRGVMRGYHNLPEATEEALAGRWLRTGDIGEIDADGFLKITDRKKDLIKTSGGKYVAPQMIEGLLKANCPYVSQVVVHGDNRNYVTAIVTLDEESIKGWASGRGLNGGHAQLTERPEVRALVKSYLDPINATLPSYATVKKFAILPTDLTVEGGELTTSLKVKRKVVETKYKPVLDGLYTGER
jgi:long-chain acyl-CoA synthetase